MMASAGATLAHEGHLILGFVKFMAGYHLVLVTRTRPIGAVSGSEVLGISDCETVRVASEAVVKAARRQAAAEASHGGGGGGGGGSGGKSAAHSDLAAGADVPVAVAVDSPKAGGGWGAGAGAGSGTAGGGGGGVPLAAAVVGGGAGGGSDGIGEKSGDSSSECPRRTTAAEDVSSAAAASASGLLGKKEGGFGSWMSGFVEAVQRRINPTEAEGAENKCVRSLATGTFPRLLPTHSLTRSSSTRFHSLRPLVCCNTPGTSISSTSWT
jgi:hypothetical protein